MTQLVHPSTASQEPADRRPDSASTGLWFAMALTVFEVGASILVFKIARNHGASQVSAYLLTCVVPLIGAAIYFLRSKDLSGASIAILAFNGLSAVVALVGDTSPKVLLYKDCFATGIVGLIFAATLVVGRPLCYYFGQRWAGGGTREGDQWWSDMYDAYPSFRECMRTITVVWAVVLLVEAGLKGLAIRLSDYDTGFVWDQILPIVAFAVAMTLTVVISRRAQAEGERRRAAAVGH